MKSFKRAALLSALFLILFTSGCSIRKNVPEADVTTPQTTVISKNLSYYYGFTEKVPLTEDAEIMLNDFGDKVSFWPAEAETELITEIPNIENIAKGVDPITVLLPDLDLTNYIGPYIEKDYETGLEVSIYYRVVADMVTDECVKIYTDSAGTLVQYKTINLGKYDAMNLNEEALTDRLIRFRDTIQSLSSITLDFFLREAIHTQSAYALFTDNEGRLVITTTTPLVTNCTLNNSTVWVDLYAVMD